MQTILAKSEGEIVKHSDKVQGSWHSCSIAYFRYEFVHDNHYMFWQLPVPCLTVTYLEG